MAEGWSSYTDSCLMQQMMHDGNRRGSFERPCYVEVKRRVVSRACSCCAGYVTGLEITQQTWVMVLKLKHPIGEIECPQPCWKSDLHGGCAASSGFDTGWRAALTVVLLNSSMYNRDRSVAFCWDHFTHEVILWYTPALSLLSQHHLLWPFLTFSCFCAIRSFPPTATKTWPWRRTTSLCALSRMENCESLIMCWKPHLHYVSLLVAYLA